jgi:formylglycine-generating enzyme required for sulfatase activity
MSILLVNTFNLYAQEFLNITPIHIQANNIKREKLISILEKNERYFSESEIGTLMDSVLRYNSNLDIKIHQAIEQRQQLVEIRQQLLQNKSYTKLTVQLAEAEANYSEILSDIKKSLQGVAYKGFYVCAIKNISPMDDPDKLIEKAKAHITPIAVRDILGFFIQSVTDLYRKEGFEDQLYTYIREEISGKLEVETKFNHAINPAERVFWYACKVVVSPLSEKLTTKSIPIEDENPNYVVINALKESNVRALASSLDIKRSIANEIENVVKANRMAVESENISIKSREENIIRNGQQKLIELSDKIKMIKLSIDQANFNIRLLVEDKIKLKYNSSNMVESIENADKYLLGKIKELYDLELSLRERKLQAEWDKVIATPGNPRVAISNTVIELKSQFETNYGKIEQFIEVAELINDDLSLAQGRKLIHQREVDRMWIFLEPLTTGFKLHTLTHLRIINSVNPTINGAQDEEKNKADNTKIIPESKNPIVTQVPSFTIQVEGNAINMIGINGGLFTMGCTSEQGSDCWSNENPVREVMVNNFFIGKYEVTQALWKVVMGASASLSNPSYFKNCDNCPVESVSWEDVQVFIEKLNKITGKNFRLPTEAEWEYAARGGASASLNNPTKFAGSNTIHDVAWHYGNSGRKTSIIARNKPNSLGLHDMSGNVSEWCEDDWRIYSTDHTTSAAWIDSPRDSRRVHRGGSWQDEPIKCRVSSRGNESPWTRDNIIGFRLALSLE